MHCRYLVWHDERYNANASPMTTDISRSLMTETPKLNWWIRCLTKNNLGIVFRYLNNRSPFPHFILFKFPSTTCIARQKTDDLAVSFVWSSSGRIPSKLCARTRENGPWTKKIFLFSKKKGDVIDGWGGVGAYFWCFVSSSVQIKIFAIWLLLHIMRDALNNKFYFQFNPLSQSCLLVISPT